MFQSFNRLKQTVKKFSIFNFQFSNKSSSNLQLPISNSFTLIEILVVATIIALLASGGMLTYSTLSKNSRDARRKADLEQIRAALEMYRSNVGAYPTTAPPAGLPFGTGALTYGTNTYLQKIPQDPKSTNTYYYYRHSLSDYTLGALLEGGGTQTQPCGNCKLSGNPTPCNYCVGPYGQK